jgi:hypothetical protein
MSCWISDAYSKNSYTEKGFIALGQTSTWSRVPGKLVQLDVTRADVVYGVNRHRLIYVGYDARAQHPWQRLPGTLKHVSAGYAGLWGVNIHDRIYYRTGVSSQNLAGTGWRGIDGEDNNLFIISKY